MRTQVAIIGAGPAGLLLSQLLMREGIETIVLERQSRDYVLSRIRAGVLEWGSVDLLEQAGVGERMHREGHVHEGCNLSSGDTLLRINFEELCASRVMIYGQTEVTRDLYNAQDALGATILHGVDAVEIQNLEGTSASVTFTHDGQNKRIDCDYVAGCDGFHGVSRNTIPASVRREFEKVYPFGWLGVLSETPPAADELIYARSPRGFALASMRNPHLSRHYIQVPLTDKVENWSDAAFWDEYRRRLPSETAETLQTGPSIEKSIAPLRSFVSEPMQWGRLFLCGDAAHIVPPTGAKGLNLAISDVYYLWRAMSAHYNAKDSGLLDQYGTQALSRVWQAMRFSWSMTTMMHNFPDSPPYDQQMQEAEFSYLARSASARRNLAENYVGLPF